MSGAADERPLLGVRGLAKRYGAQVGCLDVGFDLWPGEVLGIVGESGSGKTTVLNCLAGRVFADGGQVVYVNDAGVPVDVLALDESARRRLLRSEWGVVHQNARDGLRMGVSAGANVGERLMALGARHYGRVRGQALDWLARVEIGQDRIDDLPETFSGGMLQRLQIARNLVTAPRLVLMDEPTGGLDVSVQARLLDLLRGLVEDLGLSAVDRHARSRGGAAACPPAPGDAGRRSRGGGAHRPGARRPAASLCPAPGLLGAPAVSAPALEIDGLGKAFSLHVQGGVTLPVLKGVSLAVHPGECVVLADPSGAGKSTLLRAVYGNYLAQAGRILVQHRGRVVDMVGAPPRLVLEIRRHTIGYVSQFLRVIPRVPTDQVVAGALRARGVSGPDALDRARRRPRPARHPGAALVPLAGDVLGRRAAAGQRGPGVRRGLSHSLAR